MPLSPNTPISRSTAQASLGGYWAHYFPTGSIDATRRVGVWQYAGIAISAPSLVPGAVQVEEDVEIGLTQPHLAGVTLSRSLTMRIGRTQAFDVER